jgi:hypothetical protein
LKSFPMVTVFPWPYIHLLLADGCYGATP